MPATSVTEPAPNRPGPRHLVLVGAGPAHMHLLRAWALQPQAGVQVTLVTAQDHAWHAPRLAGFVAGHWQAQQCQWALAPLVQRSGVQWVHANLRALDADGRSIVLDDGQNLHFDWLSIALPGAPDRDALEAGMPGAREHALFVHPLAAFCTLWPQVLEMAEARPLRFTVVGAGVTGCELAMALQHRLPQASVTLLSGPLAPLSRCAPALLARVLRTLKQRNITVLQDRALAVTAQTVKLGCGADLATDVTLLATGVHLPRSLADSRLAQDAEGRLALDEFARSNSHPCVFVSGALGRGGPQADVGAAATAEGSRLAHCLAASIAGQPLDPAKSPPITPATWQLVACGGRSAIAGWAGLVFQGRWVWWLACWRNARWLAQLQHTTTPAPTKTPS